MFRNVQNLDPTADRTASAPLINRRSVVIGGASVLAVGVAARAGLGRAGAQEETGTPEADSDAKEAGSALKERLQEVGYLWTASSPATHLGDQFTLTATNPGETPITLFVLTMVMDRQGQEFRVVVRDEVNLAPSANHEFSATNEYGTANGFATRIATDAADPSALTLSATVTTEGGATSAMFTERAFLIESRDELEASREARRAARKARRGVKRRKDAKSGEAGTDASPETEATPAV